MHLDHAIPWNTISKNFYIRKNDKLSLPSNGTLWIFTEDLNPCKKPSQESELRYFSHAIANSIQEFSATERKKYPDHFPAEISGQLFCDELLQKHLVDKECATYYGTFLTEQNQHLEYWIQRAHAAYECRSDTWQYPYKVMFSSNDLDLADAVKILIIENNMSAVLTLARHPLIPLSNLNLLHWGHSFGVNRLEDYCLCSYVYLNVLAEFPEWCQNEKYWKLEAFQQLERLMTSTCDGEGQMPMHRSFFWDLNEESQGGPAARTGWQLMPSSYVRRDIFADMGRMKEYLKLCFAVLYRYDMVVKEWGGEVDWPEAIAGALNQLHVKYPR
ncbi:hypothetical protein BG006_000653 [Podila minutissima]|uniref:Uncharacterized protein n=1 Tax=Podila minutissima TaxID=64525 RepID=A0A9P5VHN5_9FUNG|nr:hypothetical protein BG006_000653 [Podila minutissima]